MPGTHMSNMLLKCIFIFHFCVILHYACENDLQRPGCHVLSIGIWKYYTLECTEWPSRIKYSRSLLTMNNTSVAFNLNIIIINSKNNITYMLVYVS